MEAGETGLVGAVNQAAGRAKGDFLAILNGGNEPREGWLAALVGRAEPTSIAVVVPKVLSPGGLIHEAGGLLSRTARSGSTGTPTPRPIPSSPTRATPTTARRGAAGTGGRVARDRWARRALLPRLLERRRPLPRGARAGPSRGLRAQVRGGAARRPALGVDPSMATPEQRDRAKRALVEKWADAFRAVPTSPGTTAPTRGARRRRPAGAGDRPAAARSRPGRGVGRGCRRCSTVFASWGAA